MTPLLVLVVERESALREDLATELARAAWVDHAGSLEEARQALCDQGHDALVVDTRAGALGLEVLEAVGRWSVGTAPVAVTAAGPEAVLSAVRAGAMDCLPENLMTPGTLARLVERAVERARARQALWEAARGRAGAGSEPDGPEEALRLRDRAIDAISQGLLIADARHPDLPIIHANAGFERITGYAAADVIGRNSRFLQGPDTDPAVARDLGQSIRSGQAARVEILNYRKNGQPFWNDLSITPIRDQAGQLTHLVGLLTDVTERRDLEQQLRHAQKTQALGRLAGGVAHDFNNLLTAIVGHADLGLARVGEGTRERRSLEEIRACAFRGAALTRQLLAYSRKQVLQPQILDLNAALRGLEALLGRVIGEDVDLRFELGEDLGLVEADPGQIEQVVVNLAVNARDAMPDGGSLTFSTANLGEGEVRLSVADTGTGMDAATLAHACEPFFTTKEVGKGTGLGLATVDGIVRQSGGRLELSSAVGQGTTVRIVLPRVAAMVAPEERPEPRPPRQVSAAILIVEDEPALGVLMREVLSEEGHDVRLVRSAGEALAAANGTPIALLVSDVILPGMKGPELARRLRQLHPALRVLLVSGYTADTVDLKEPGFPFLAKPFSPASLVDKVNEVLASAGPEPSWPRGV